MIGIIDYGMGNLRSVQKGLQHVGCEAAEIISTPEQVTAADKLILPGVGAFEDAMTNLRDRSLIEPIIQRIGAGVPFLGVCLGMQLLFEISEEDGEHTGLGVMAGRVVRFEPSAHHFKVPQMGWNALQIAKPGNPLFAGVADGSHVYFVHSYYAQPTDPAVIAARTDYDGLFCCSVWRENVFAMQFHPEKSQKVGLRILENFDRL